MPPLFLETPVPERMAGPCWVTKRCLTVQKTHRQNLWTWPPKHLRPSYDRQFETRQHSGRHLDHSQNETPPQWDRHCHQTRDRQPQRLEGEWLVRTYEMAASARHAEHDVDVALPPLPEDDEVLVPEYDRLLLLREKRQRQAASPAAAAVAVVAYAFGRLLPPVVEARVPPEDLRLLGTSQEPQAHRPEREALLWPIDPVPRDA
mmetsp:Transcript_34981/g.51989  ORF Transcript_34981/g.51989 Transcript_34981/m.51989 type:complete len:204 (-) Transcript_34981:840-1451(-)